jgi:hypothetical protein
MKRHAYELPCRISNSLQEQRIRGMRDASFHGLSESDVYNTCTCTLWVLRSSTEKNWFIFSNEIFNILVDKYHWFTVNASWPIPVGSWELIWYRPNQGAILWKRTVTSFIDEVETWTNGFRLPPLLSLKAWNRTRPIGGTSIIYKL